MNSLGNFREVVCEFSAPLMFDSQGLRTALQEGEGPCRVWVAACPDGVKGGHQN
jgi:hypothetical protein